MKYPIYSILSQFYVHPLWRYEAAPQYFSLNLAGSGVSSKEANMLAHVSQLLEGKQNSNYVKFIIIHEI